MSAVKSGYIFLILVIIAFLNAPHNVQAQTQTGDANYLKGYVPPPMFGGSSKPLDGKPLPAPVPQVTAPVVAPALMAPPLAKAEPKPAKEITRQPEDRKPAPQVAKAEPKKQEAPKPAAKPTPALNAESLLDYPVTSKSEMPVATLNPMAAPAPNVEDALPLPGSVKPQKTIKPATKATEKKIAKKEIKKPEPKKLATKTEPKKVRKLAAKKVETPKEISKTPAKTQIETSITAKKKEPAKESAAYSIKGKKSMPKVISTKVDSAELDKPVLPPAAELPSEKTLPLPNEKPKAAQAPITVPDVAPVAAADKARPQLISLEFKSEQTDIGSDLKKIVDNDILPKLKADQTSRLQILSYASASKEGQSSARRISLARGLALRAYLLEKGLKPERIDIRALGENTTEQPLDRADLMIISYK